MEKEIIIPITIKEALMYEIHSHWLTGYIWFDWGQELMAKYLLRKATKKHNRYLYSIKLRNRLLCSH